MPTPSEIAPQLSVARAGDVSGHLTCPPEIDRSSSWRASSEEGTGNNADDDEQAATSVAAQSRMRSSSPVDAIVVGSPASSAFKKVSPQEDDLLESMSPSSMATEVKDEQSAAAVALPDRSASPSYEFSNIRLLPNHTSSFLRPGSKFVGTQQSDRQIYNVDVEIKHVDMAESYLCGYLRIQGLTEDHPTLTTYFEGEIIGTKHTFQTRHASWGATDKTDMHHWARFPAWRPLAKQAKKPDFTYRNFAQRENIFMRWKEYFLVPDHRVRTISGASFEGFYYICFNQVEGTISGIYFHAKSEKYQQLELKHVENRGCFGAMEFR